MSHPDRAGSPDPDQPEDRDDSGADAPVDGRSSRRGGGQPHQHVERAVPGPAPERR